MGHEIKRLGYPQTGDFIPDAVLGLMPEEVQQLERAQHEKLEAYNEAKAAELNAKRLHEDAPLFDSAKAQEAIAAGKPVPKPTEAKKLEDYEKSKLATEAHRIAYGEARVAKEDALRSQGAAVQKAVQDALQQAAEQAIDHLSGFTGEWERVQDVTGLLTGLSEVAEGQRPEFRRGRGLPTAREKVLVPTPEQLLPELVGYVGNFREED
jgi:hypothetical protein